MTIPLPIITPLDRSTLGSGVDFGARVTGVDLNVDLSEASFAVIERALYEHKVLIFPGQNHLEPDNQFAFVRRFDPEAPVGLCSLPSDPSCSAENLIAFSTGRAWS